MKTRTILSIVAAVTVVLVGMNPAFAEKPLTVIATNAKDKPVRKKTKRTVKTKVEAEVVEPYIFQDFGEDSVSASDSECYFDVPAGKVLHIESVSGFTRKGNVLSLAVQPDPAGGGSSVAAIRIPRAIQNGINFLYEANGRVYATDENIFTDSNGVTRDFRVVVRTDGASTTGENGACTVTGRLFDAVTP